MSYLVPILMALLPVGVVAGVWTGWRLAHTTQSLNGFTATKLRKSTTRRTDDKT